MKYIFFGTPKEATTVLDVLKSYNFLPVLIVTAPDRPAGRGLRLEQSPVAVWGQDNGIPVLKPESLKTPQIIEEIKKITNDTPAEVGIVFAYGKIIPQNVLDLPIHGTLNIHPSLLPLHRGPAPVEGAILSKDTETGVSIMVLDAQMDHGPIVDQQKVVLTQEETAPDLLKKLIEIGSKKLSVLLPDFISGKIKMLEQKHENATYTKKITKNDGEIHLSDDPETMYTKYRAYFGWPGTYFFENNNGNDVRIAIKKARFENNTFVIERIVPEGKKEMDYADYLRGKK